MKTKTNVAAIALAVLGLTACDGPSPLGLEPQPLQDEYELRLVMATTRPVPGGEFGIFLLCGDKLPQCGTLHVYRGGRYRWEAVMDGKPITEDGGMSADFMYPATGTERTLTLAGGFLVFEREGNAYYWWRTGP